MRSEEMTMTIPPDPDKIDEIRENMLLLSPAMSVEEIEECHCLIASMSVAASQLSATYDRMMELLDEVERRLKAGAN